MESRGAWTGLSVVERGIVPGAEIVASIRLGNIPDRPRVVSVAPVSPASFKEA